jgi:hypothetical protein
MNLSDAPWIVEAGTVTIAPDGKVSVDHFTFNGVDSAGGLLMAIDWAHERLTDATLRLLTRQAEPER